MRGTGGDMDIVGKMRKGAKPNFYIFGGFAIIYHFCGN